MATAPAPVTPFNNMEPGTFGDAIEELINEIPPSTVVTVTWSQDRQQVTITLNEGN